MAENEPPQPQPDDEFMDVQEVLETLDISRSTLYRWLREGRLAGRKAGRQWRFRRSDVQRFLAGLEPAFDLPVDISPLVGRLSERLAEVGGDTEASQDGDASDVARAVALMVRLGDALRASDMSIEPQVGDDGEQLAVLRYRIDGVLHAEARFNIKLLPAVVEQWKRMAACDVNDKVRPQDGRILVELGPRPLDLRVCFVSAQFGESVTVRLLDRTAVTLDLARMNFTPHDRERVNEALSAPDGLILVTGPTGCGKTTVIYSMLTELADPSVKIMTVEDPVEYLLPGTVQIPVRAAEGLTHARAIRSMLRSATDVIFVGEIRDRETAMLCMQAAMTGHLVFSTLHTNDAASTLVRLVEMGVDPFVVADPTRLIVAQRLVRRLCPKCSKPASGQQFVDRARQLGDEIGLEIEGLDQLREPAGCRECKGVGYRGRMLIAETLRVTPAIGDALREGAGTDRLREIAVAEGMVPWPIDGVRRACGGETSLGEVMRYVGG